MKNQNLRDAFSSLKMNVDEIETLSDPSALSSIKGGDGSCGTMCKKMGNTSTTTVSPPISVGLGK